MRACARARAFMRVHVYCQRGQTAPTDLPLPRGHVGLQVAAAVARTAEWIQPLLTAYLYEGSRHFNGPRQIGGPLASQCVKGGCPDGSDWTAVAQVQPGIPQHALYNMRRAKRSVQAATGLRPRGSRLRPPDASA